MQTIDCLCADTKQRRLDSLLLHMTKIHVIDLGRLVEVDIIASMHGMQIMSFGACLGVESSV